MLEQPIGGAVLHLRSDVDGGLEEYREWCDRVHHREVLARGGYLSVRRFELQADCPWNSPGSARWLTVYQLEDADVAGRPAAPGEAPMPSAVQGLRYVRTVYRQLSPPDGSLTASGPRPGSRQAIGTAVLNVMIDVEPGWDDRYNAWYDEDHLPALAGIPGVVSARRFVAATDTADDPTRHRYLSLYELEDPDVVLTDAFAAAGAPSPRSQELSAHRQTWLQVYRQVFPDHGALEPGD